MSSLKERVQAVINSKTRLSPGTSTSGNFTYSFDHNITRITDIIIKSVQIPYTFYSINSLNNVLKFNSNAISVTITSGNYTAASLQLELKTKIDTAFADTTTVVTFSNITYKLTITRDTAFVIDAVADVATSTLAKYIGFNVSSTSATTATGDSVINIAGPNYINIESSFLTKATQHKVAYGTNLYANILLTVPLLWSPGDIISIGEQPLLPVRLNYKFSINTTDIIDIKLKDDLGNILNLNGSDFSMQFVFITE